VKMNKGIGGHGVRELYARDPRRKDESGTRTMV
jgi:hypothetical protein